MATEKFCRERWSALSQIGLRGNVAAAQCFSRPLPIVRRQARYQPGYKQRGENVSYITYAKRSNGRKKKPGDDARLSTLIKDQRQSLIR
jgi:hypothetical protein